MFGYSLTKRKEELNYGVHSNCTFACKRWPRKEVTALGKEHLRSDLYHSVVVKTDSRHHGHLIPQRRCDANTAEGAPKQKLNAAYNKRDYDWAMVRAVGLTMAGYTCLFLVTSVYWATAHS